MSVGAFLIFSGHNDRAVIALCRFFYEYQLPFVIVAASSSDLIFKTKWSNNVVFCRLNKNLDPPLFKQLKSAADNFIAKNQKLIYCPTSEFMNQFVLCHRDEIERMDIITPMPPYQIYLELTNKMSSLNFVESIAGVRLPPRLEWDKLSVPCVFKPKNNISGRMVHYPILCLSEKDLESAVNQLDSDFWFAQKYVVGQSYYLCGYLGKDGRRAYYWQTNLMQQYGGKSIVLAKTGMNLDIDEEFIFDKLGQIGYFGPFMMEIIQDNNGDLYYIEINPRFWGPLQLAVDAYPEVIALFASSLGYGIPNLRIPEDRIKWYAWAKGARSQNCKKYPALGQISINELNQLVDIYDVYGREDTRLLHGIY